MRRFLIVFAKEPVKGKVKTRLNGCLSSEKRLNLYKAFLRDTVDLTNKIKCENKILAYDSNKEPGFLKKIAPNFVFYKQNGENLGMRMLNVLKFITKDNFSKAVIIGSDAPTLPACYIEKAFRQLDKKDIVLGPTLDGGYYLIGFKRPCSGVFRGIKWSANSVLKNTINNIKNLKRNFSLLDEWYDVDDKEALIRLKLDLKKERDKSVAQWTRKFLKI